MFATLLIANRGEIACRIIRTARRMGIRTVAVFSDADRSALHVEMADEAVHLGGAQASESYLAVEKLIAAARKTGAEAIHPGYGFLSENPEFADAVKAAGMTFVGPSSDAIRSMGLKDAAKQLMEQAGVPVVPGYHGEAQDVVVLAQKADEVGYPVLIKARAGGGGKGMRLVASPSDFADSLQAARREAEAAFGDGRVLVEKFITAPRHIEIQVFGDETSNAVHLFERDCSLQRRHQKVIEEAPAPGMPVEMREAMGAAAVRAAKAIHYSGAGTVEFIVDSSGGLDADQFYFMEMNTRLQVEHPVTEMITGVDLVEWQLRVANGEPLPLQQHELSINGWSFEARLYAEDPCNDFLPATGSLSRLVFPEEPIRVDSGVREGDAITPFYDPMIAKVISHGPDRTTALAGLRSALSQTAVIGTKTNAEFLYALAHNTNFADGQFDTGLIENALPELNSAKQPSEFMVTVAALACLGLQDSDGEAGDPFVSFGLWSHWLPAKRIVHLQAGQTNYVLAISRISEREWKAESYQPTETAFGPVQLVLRSAERKSLTIEHEGVVSRIRCTHHQSELVVSGSEGVFAFQVPDLSGEADSETGLSDHVVSPMPGLVKKIHVKPGQTVDAGQALIIMEAMKMEMTLTAPRDAEIAELMVEQDEQVSDGKVLITFAQSEP